jgi:hypothetical protein
MVKIFMNNFSSRSQIFCLLLLILFGFNAEAKKPSSYGRIYNVQDYINVSGGDATLGIQRCMTDVNQKIWQVSNGGNHTIAHTYTILFPRSIYIINEVLKPFTLVTPPGTGYKHSFNRVTFPNLSDIYAPITIHILGLDIDHNQLSPILGNTFTPIPNSNNWSAFGAENYTSANFTNCGINATPTIETFLNAHLSSVHINCQMNPASNTFLSYQPGPMPHLQSTNANQHDFFDINCSGHSSTEPYIFDPNTKMMNFIINISGLHMEGIPSSNNSHIYNALTPSSQHDVTFQMGTAVKITNFQSVFVDNLFIENIYGNGIFVKNTDYALRNDSCNINSNVVLNTWGLKYKKVNGQFDNTGDAILTQGIRNGVSYFNYIKNDLATTHQYGRLGLGTCCEHNKDCSAEFNYVSGYDRGIHIENGRGGFQVRYNRITGSETGIVMDGIRSYLKKYNPPLPSGQLYIECDAEHASRIEYNYISNEEIPMQEDSLMKIYPPQLIFADGMNWSNTDNSSFFKNNFTYINIDNIPDHYKAPVLDGTNDPRPYAGGWYRSQSYHLFSSVKKQEVDCNVFKTTLSSDPTKNIHGGTHFQSGIYSDFIDPDPDTPNHCDMSEFLLNDSINNSVPMYCRGNSYTDCYKNWFNLWVSSSNNFYENTITGNTLLMPNPDLVFYTKANPNSGSSFSCPLLTVNNTFCNGKPLIVDITEYDEFWQNTTLSNTTNLNNKTILITGTLTLNADLNLSNCRIFLTSHANIVLNSGTTLTANSGCVFRAICEDMWDGIYADDPTAQITIENSTLRDMENGINVSLGAKLNVDNNQFIDNYNSLRIDGNINLTDVTITQNNFGISGNPLLAPHIGELPRHGIYIRNSASLEVGGFGVDEGNSFQFMENAVKIFNETTMQTIGQSPNQQLQIIPAPASFIQLKNNKFLGIHKNNSSSGDPDLGVGIYAEANSLFGGNLRLYVSDVLNPSMNTYKNFSNCEQAIRLIQASAEVFNQHISNCGIGIAALQCEGERYRINDNFFDQTYWSIIKSGDESQLGFLIANNTIVMPEDEPILIGLPPLGILSAYSSKIHNGYSEIGNNTIHSTEGLAGIGISLNNGASDKISNNKIHLLNTQTESGIGIPKLVGIYSNSSDRPRIENNLVDNDFFNNPSLTHFVNNNNAGIYVHENKNSILHCNLTNFTRFGIFATGANGNQTNYDQTAGNVMNNSHSNILLVKLQVEGSLGQMGKYDPFGIIFDANNTFTPNLQSGPLNNVYRVTDCPQSNTSDEIVTDATRLTQQQSSASNTNNNVCDVKITNPSSITSGFVCGDENPWGDLDLEYALAVAAENTEYTDFEEGGRENDEEWIYNWLRNNVSARAQYPILDAFYLNRYSGLVGQLNRIDEAIAALGDSILRSQPQAWLTAHANALTMNNTLDTTVLFGANAKKMNAFFLSSMLPNSEEWSAEEKEMIETLALSCPYTQGTAVYKARVLYARFAPPTHFDDLVICNSQGVYKNGPSKLDQLIYQLNHTQKKSAASWYQESIEVYPNPAHRELKIKGKQLRHFQLTDILGIPVFSSSLNEKQETHSFQLPELKTGVYLYSIETPTGMQSGKLLIE